MGDDVTDEVDKMTFVVDVSYANWMMSRICYILRKLYLIPYNISSLYSYREC
jgi:hypothetical protein